MAAKAVFFDIDNTMYNFNAANVIAMEEIYKYGGKEFSLSPGSMKMILSKAQETVTKRLGTDSPAIHNRLIRFQCFLELLHYPVFTKAMEMNNLYWNTLFGVIKPEPGLIHLLKALKEAEIPAGIGSDQNAGIQYHKLKVLGVLEYISFIVTSEEAGKEKPAPVFFNLCVSKANCKPEECIFIGDNIKKDVEGALHSGLNGVLYCPEWCKNSDDKNIYKDRYPVIHSYNECLQEGFIKKIKNM